ncbi:hypothetical protein ACFO4N_09050 [Camelliibacillus cellulosilyticus]|uniref:Uncharacterized protein n=1 Tax=Camelliibacillus cellulosilyticus TaxID=2174486 RepID=A0ABV9GNW3_9BACL
MDRKRYSKNQMVSLQNPRDKDWEELTELIQEAYLRAAPKRLVKAWISAHKR